MQMRLELNTTFEQKIIKNNVLKKNLRSKIKKGDPKDPLYKRLYDALLGSCWLRRQIRNFRLIELVHIMHKFLLG